MYNSWDSHNPRENKYKMWSSAAIAFVSSIALIIYGVQLHHEYGVAGNLPFYKTAHALMVLGILAISLNSFADEYLTRYIREQKEESEKRKENERLEKERARKLPYSNNDVAFSNTLYKCENDACHTRFFRMYQLFEAYKDGNLHIPGDSQVDEKSYAENFSPELFQEFGLVACPKCHAKMVRRAREYDWMKTDPVFPRLDLDELNARREDFPVTASLNRLDEMLDDLSKRIDQIQEIDSYQHHYGLKVPHDAFVRESINDIQSRLKNLQHFFNIPHVQEKTQQLIDRLNQSGDSYFEITVPAATKINVDPQKKELLEKAKDASRDWVYRQHRHRDSPDHIENTCRSLYEHDIDGLADEYTGKKKKTVINPKTEQTVNITYSIETEESLGVKAIETIIELLRYRERNKAK